MAELATPARRKEATAPGSSDAVALVVYTTKPTEQCACSDGPGIQVCNIVFKMLLERAVLA